MTTDASAEVEPRGLRARVVRKSLGGADERVARASRLTRLMRRPEAGAIVGLIATFVIFALLPGAESLYSLQGSMTFLTLAAELGILAAAVALLIIAGEFDLSIGSMIGFAGIVIGLLVTRMGWPLWASIGAAFGVAVLVGYLNGLITVKTRLPSFIVTLASLFILRGLSIGITRAVTGRTQIPYILDAPPDPWTAAHLQRACPDRASSAGWPRRTGSRPSRTGRRWSRASRCRSSGGSSSRPSPAGS